MLFRQHVNERKLFRGVGFPRTPIDRFEPGGNPLFYFPPSSGGVSIRTVIAAKKLILPMKIVIGV
jgi:hypothetical protein